jgi:NADPH-dependent FMN reductase
MNREDFRILGLAGSLRRASVHRGIVRAAHEVGPEWMSCESFDLGRIPYFNQDLEDEGNPEFVEELRQKIRAYEAVLIATPEYDYAIPGVLTATLDWTLRSRYDPTPFRHKPVGIVGASPGGAGTARGTDGIAADTFARSGLRDARAADAHPLLAPEVRRADRRSRGRGDPQQAAPLFGGAGRVVRAGRTSGANPGDDGLTGGDHLGKPELAPPAVGCFSRLRPSGSG